MGDRTSTKPRKRPRQRRSEETVAAILEAAARVFSERGYARGTTNHIASRAGVSVGSLYQYFPNKDAILVELYRGLMTRAAASLEEAVASAARDELDLEASLARIIGGLFEVYGDRPECTHVLLHDTPRSHETHHAVQELEEAMAHALSGLFEGRFGVGERHASHAGYLVVHVVLGLVQEYLVHPPRDLPRDAFEREVVRLVLGYLLEPCGSAPPRVSG